VACGGQSPSASTRLVDWREVCWFDLKLVSSARLGPNLQEKRVNNTYSWWCWEERVLTMGRASKRILGLDSPINFFFLSHLAPSINSPCTQNIKSIGIREAWVGCKSERQSAKKVNVVKYLDIGSVLGSGDTFSLVFHIHHLKLEPKMVNRNSILASVVL
jgi:hypothetical protein